MRRFALLAFVTLAGCASPRERGFEPDPAPPLLTPDSGSDDDKNLGAGPNIECADDNKNIFVLSEQNSLYSFHPPTLEFKHVGMLRCPTGGATPTSMAVDRFGFAWVRHTDASVWKVHTRTLDCQPTTFTPPGDNFFQFGMGFSSSSKGSSDEELFLSDSSGAGLAKLDTSTMTLTPIGPYTGALAGKAAELTGTGDGQLFGFFVSAPAHVAEISKTTGEILNAAELPGVYGGNAWAFSFYAGDFYIYTSSDGSGGGPPRAGAGSDVTRYSPADGSITVVKSKIGFKIVGAGVSTCAPTEGPK